MKRITVLLLAVIFAAFVFTPRGAVSSQGIGKSNPHYVQGQIIVKLREEARPSVSQVRAVDPGQLAQMVLTEEGASAESLESSEPGESGMYVVHLSKGVSVEDAIQRASRDPR